MVLDESNKAFVRQFLASEAAQNWLNYCSANCPKLDLAKMNDVEVFRASLLMAEGWRQAIEFLETSVQESQPQPHYGREAIDNTF